MIDNGSGIEAAIIDKIFDPFFTTRATGTGLGLALSHRIISRWGGELLVDSTRGRGAALPYACAATPCCPAAASPRNWKGGASPSMPRGVRQAIDAVIKRPL